MPSIKELETWLSVADVAVRLGISKQSVRNMAEDRRLRGIKTRVGWLIDPAGVQDLAEKRGMGTPRGTSRTGGRP